MRFTLLLLLIAFIAAGCSSGGGGSDPGPAFDPTLDLRVTMSFQETVDGTTVVVEGDDLHADFTVMNTALPGESTSTATEATLVLIIDGEVFDLAGPASVPALAPGETHSGTILYTTVAGDAGEWTLGVIIDAVEHDEDRGNDLAVADVLILSAMDG